MQGACLLNNYILIKSWKLLLKYASWNVYEYENQYTNTYTQMPSPSFKLEKVDMYKFLHKKLREQHV